MSEPLDPALFHECENIPVPVRIGDKWTAKILVCLKDGKRRFSELRVPLPEVTPKVLTESLRAMERDGLVVRHAHPEVPPRVEYEITDLGRTLLELMEATCAWTAAHLAELLRARQAYQERTAS